MDDVITHVCMHMYEAIHRPIKTPVHVHSF